MHGARDEGDERTHSTNKLTTENTESSKTLHEVIRIRKMMVPNVDPMGEPPPISLTEEEEDHVAECDSSHCCDKKEESGRRPTHQRTRDDEPNHTGGEEA
jgi:hypothetical protein